MSKEYEIGMSPNVDIQPQSIMDVAPELIKKMYVYHIPKKAGESNAFFVPGATTFLGIATKGIINKGTPEERDMFEPLDADGIHRWVNVLPNEILQGYLSHSASTSFIGTDLDYQNSMLIYTEQYFPMDRGERFLVTFDSPFDTNKFVSREQQAYLVNEGKLVTEEFQDLPPEYTQKNADKGSVFSLQPLHVIMDSQPYTKIIPYFWNESSTAFNNGIADFEVNRDFLIQKVTALGLNSKTGEIKNVELVNSIHSSAPKTGEITHDKNTGFMPFKVYPSNSVGKLDIFADWQDKSTIIPWETIEKNS